MYIYFILFYYNLGFYTGCHCNQDIWTWALKIDMGYLWVMPNNF